VRLRGTLLFVAILAGWLWLDARAQGPGPIVSGAHRFEKVAEGVYYATASSSMNVGANSPTRRRLLTNVMEQYTYLSSVEPVPARVAALKDRIAQEKDPQQKATLERQMATQLAYLEQVREIKVTPPNTTVKTSMTLYRGNREIQIPYLGRGHTDTDLVV
jgi:hypothetical protein